MAMQGINWLFFDVGSTLVDETECYNHRIRDAIAGTDITFEQFNEKRIFFAKQNLKGDIEAITYFGLTKTPWHTEDEKPYSEAEKYDIINLVRKDILRCYASTAMLISIHSLIRGRTRILRHF